MQAKKRCALVMYDNKACGVVVELLWDGDLVNFDDSWDRRFYTIKIMWITQPAAAAAAQELDEWKEFFLFLFYHSCLVELTSKIRRCSAAGSIEALAESTNGPDHLHSKINIIDR